jgi:hypothetical protein
VSEMVERVAKALWVHDDDLLGNMGQTCSWEDASGKQIEPYRWAARAAIATMRGPTDGMRQAAWTAHERTLSGSEPLSAVLWNAMIDAALAE